MQSAGGQSPDRRREHASTRTRSRPNVDQNWARQGLHSRTRSDCNQNFGDRHLLAATSSPTWGAVVLQRHRSSRGSPIKDDLTLVRGTHTIKTGFTVSTASRRTASASRIIGGRAGFELSGRPPFPERRRCAAAGGKLVRVCSWSAHADTGRTRDHPLSPAGLSVLRVLRAGRLAAERQARLQLRPAVTSSRGRRSPAAISTRSSIPTKPNPGVNGYPGALIFAGEGART